MKTLRLYVVRQMLTTLGMTVLVFTGLLLLGNILKEVMALLVQHQVPLFGVIQAVALLIPYALVFALPMGMLTATLLVFGRLSADQELTAVRAGGVSLLSLVGPVLGLGVLASGVAAYANIQLAPSARVGYKELLYELGVARPTAILVEGRYLTDFPGWTIYIGARRGENEFSDVLLHETRQDQLVRRIRARRAVVSVDAGMKQMIFRLFDAEVFTRSGSRPTGGGVGDQPPGGDLDWGMAFFDEAPPVRLDLAGMQPQEGKPKFSEMTGGQLRAELDVCRQNGLDPTPVLVNLNRQVSFSFACLSFTLVGIPLGIRAHRRETSIGIAAALVLTAIYYSFIILGQSWETRPQMFPQLIVWLPNFLFQGIGAWLLWRANRILG